MKKILIHFQRSVLFAIFLFLASLNSAYAKEISLAYSLENYDFTLIFDEFTAQTGIKIKVASFKNNDLKSELIQRANIKELPDAVIVPSDFTGLGSINVSTISKDLINADIRKAAINSTLVDNKSRGIPIVYGNHLLLYYNKNIIANAGQTWSEILQQGGSINEDQNLIAWSYLEMYWFIPFLGTFGEFPFVDNQVLLNTKGMVQALKWYKNLSVSNIVDLECDYVCSQNQFMAGTLAYSINGSWAYGQYKKSLGDFLGLALLPRLGDKEMQPYFSSHVLAFPGNGLHGPKQKELRLLATYFQSEKVQEMIWDTLKSIPTNSKTLAKIMSKGNADFDVLMTQLEQSEPMPNEKSMAIVWEAMLKGTNRYLADVLDAEAAARYMQHVAEKSIGHGSARNDND
ncbi:extracellular solute-binding protein [Psychrosphaera haliotis]|uniref:Extracellular solute-binding protein n=1 Tax=Psychrosphaera haliotis TaxID=555083 RepID=A0A6N8F3M1_9GAMM|nr:extracellular solute-binding protein [Psychrosphaera haliotis]MUH71195.1 extracellular solute-binding protein [Psychrosphaera haliotis]